MNPLIEKYNVPAPRYTSYPTVPYWDAIAPREEEWKEIAKAVFIESNLEEGISIYIHLPFCESLCTYCGCNTRITVNHGVELPYIQAILKEWRMYLELFNTLPRIKEIHLGGGTPTFFKPENLEMLLEGIVSSGVVCEDAEFSFEGHPNNTRKEHLQILFNMGFRRISLGIQDFDLNVQDIINRIQTVGDVERVTAQAKEIGYSSVNYDLIYGLPLQTMDSMKRTIDHVIRLRPDRIAFYSYAHVPWIKPGQRKFTEADLPSGDKKRALYESGREFLEKAGYVEIGMDHFVLDGDPLLVAFRTGTIHRNFMGYTRSHTQLMIGLGVSSISDAWGAFAQNEKKVEDYYEKINAGILPIFKGHILSKDDRILRKHILNLMCQLETGWEKEEERCDLLYQGLERMKEMEEDGLIIISNERLKINPAGRPFIRNICMALDAKIWENQPKTQLFSKVI